MASALGVVRAAEAFGNVNPLSLSLPTAIHPTSSVNGYRIAAVLWRARTPGRNPNGRPYPFETVPSMARLWHGYTSALIRYMY